MNQKIVGKHENDVNGNPAGGQTTGTGILVNWQDGPLGRGIDRKDPNGAFVEGVIAAAIDRLQYYQDSKFKCRENEVALMNLNLALATLNERTADREKRDVEGTHTV